MDDSVACHKSFLLGFPTSDSRKEFQGVDVTLGLTFLVLCKICIFYFKLSQILDGEGGP